MRQRIIGKGVEPGRVLVVRDCALLPDKVPLHDHPVAKEVRCGFRFVVLHAGNLGFYGAWETLVDAARLLEGEGVGFIFVGNGASKDRVAALGNGSRNIRFLPFRPTKDVPFVLAAGDLHLVTVRAGLEGVVVPSKLYGILAAGRPVLAVAHPQSDVARIVAKSGAGIVADPNDPGAVAAGIRGLMSDRKKLDLMAQRARSAALEYEQSRELKRFVRLVEEMAGA